ncbi:hypothetical protein RUM43_014525 [Polyplax serrata]|uniref:C2H2-type domain-containing protein n=1 Tax=Polyplax serrata TaxID=468196 RepID=A0AAN8P462_POLSC
MESASKQISGECFLKIGTYWSEAEENFESIAIKEEIVSDVEPEASEDKEENISNGGYVKSKHNEKKCDGNIFSGNPPTGPRLSLHKTLKNKSHGNPNCTSIQLELSNDTKLSCLHETKSFKIVNRRLRCGTCRSLVCPECFKVMHSTLHNHFLGFDTSNYSIYACKFCSFPFPSVCALQAHVRIHTMDTPYVCPDCGLIYSNAYFLILHLINKCLHIYKSVTYKCKGCSDIYFEIDSFAKHIKDAHVTSIFRCSYCSLLFNTADEFSHHTESNHQKQKVQYLNYFRCNLCSDMVLTNLMYEKHIEFHSENSHSYEVEYHCPCGNGFNLIGAFRAHIQFCDEKGTLPPQWAFLKKNLKTQDFVSIQIENINQKIDGIPGQGVNASSCLTFNTEGGCNEKINSGTHLLKNGIPTSENEKEEHSNLLGNNKFGTSDRDGASEECFKLSRGGNIKDTDTIKKLSSGKVETAPSRANENAKDEDNMMAIRKSHVEGADDGQTEGKDAPMQEDGAINRYQDSCKSSKGTEDSEADVATLCYDHIPCDHMGYVKTQGPEASAKNRIGGGEEKTEEISNGLNNYRIVLELDDKTGLMISRKVPVKPDKVAENPEEQEMKAENYFPSENCESEIGVVNNDDFLTKFPSYEKGKSKGSSSFFTCPFCIVMFPKHSSTFQQFRLHLEYYHVDAALNVTIRSGDLSDFKESGERAGQGNFEEFHINHEKKKLLGNNGFRKIDSHMNTVNKMIPEGKAQYAQYEALDFEGEKYFNEINQGMDIEGEKEEVRTIETKIYGENEKKNLTKETNSSPDKGLVSKSDRFLSVKGADEAREVRKATHKLGQNSGFLGGGLENVESMKVTNSSNQHDKKPGEPVENDSQHNEVITISRKTEQAKRKKSNSSIRKTLKMSRGIKSAVKSEKEYESVEFELENRETSMKNICSGERKNMQVTSDGEEEWENSKDSSWSNTNSEFDVRDENVESFDENLVRMKGTEKCKRESEVWSELYESLQLAEKLKKSKKSKMKNCDETQTKSSTLVDYSAKRVVKKPKRYRESSESEFSLDGVENSESDTEFRTKSNGHAEEIMDGEGNRQEEDKKQKLLRKLKNIDQKFVDYLFDLITRKEKCIELYKKHSGLRFGQHLRSHRKKILNGIKLRGRPVKLALRYQRQGPTKKEPPLVVKEGNLSNTDVSFHGKSNERKRGRPRKAMDPAKLIDRRRSNREVDFIEKHFDREESGSSPSKRKRKLSSKLQYYKRIGLSEEKEDFSSGQLIANKVSTDSNKKFMCAVCKEIYQDGKEFREHIGSHRLEENTYQCLECGECFVVRPSLEKHLLAFHKIKNTERYITENERCTPQKEVVEPEVETLKENQCKVCRDQFERAIDLTKHFRIHGMAFLKEFKKETKEIINEKKGKI